jgi:hypothetical protein
MYAKSISSPRFDGIDAQRFKEMVDSEAFARFTLRVTAELKRAEEACVRDVDEVLVRRAQGAVVALRTVIGLPASILREMEAANPSK